MTPRPSALDVAGIDAPRPDDPRIRPPLRRAALDRRERKFAFSSEARHPPASARLTVHARTTRAPSYRRRFCFLPADTGGYVNDVHGMVSTKIKFHITSQFALLHYITATGSEKTENSDSVANWDDVYKSKSTCLERINNEFAFPFYLAELARAAVPAPPPPPSPPSVPSPPPANASASRRLLAAEAPGGATEDEALPTDRLTGGEHSRGFERHTAAFAATPLSDEPYLEVPLRYSPAPRRDASSTARSLLQTADDEHGTYDPLTGKTTYVINGQTIVVDGDQAGSSTAWGIGLVDITQVNAVDAYTNLPLDNSAKLRIYGGGWVEVVRTTFYVGERARFFYVAGANCDRLCSTTTCNGDLNIEYDIEFTNGFEWYSKHFSADQIGVLETSIAFMVLYVALGACYFLTRKELKKLRKHHHTVKMLGSAIILGFFSHSFFFLHYIWYSSDGVGNMLFLFLARILQLSSETTFLVLLVLIAKGWTICCRKISARGRVKIAVFATVYAICWLLAVAYHHFVADKASTLHMYQSGFGYFLCALRFFALGWFWYSVSVTNKKYASKVAFYKKFAASFALWFYGLPIIVIVAQSIPPWQRFMVVNAMEFTFLFAFQLALLAMYVPNSGFNKSFPFHATTNETFLYAGNRPAAMRSANGARRVTVGSAGAAPNGDGRGAAKPGRPGELSDWDKKELARAVHSAKVMTHETKKILDCLTQIEANNELESDDEAYENPATAPLRALGSSGATRGVVNGVNGMNGSGFIPNGQPRGESRVSEPRSPGGREYGSGAYPPPSRSFGAGVDADRSRATAFDAGSTPDDVESHGAYGDAYGGSDGPRSSGGHGDGRSGYGDGQSSGYGSPRNNPIFASGNAGPQAAVAGAFQPTPPISPANRAGLPPLSEGAARFGDVAGQRSLLARLGKNRGSRPLGSGGYT